MLEYTLTRIVDCSNWDELVHDTYGKPYCFQQQNGCQSRGTRSITIPSEDNDYYDGNEDYPNEIPFEINGNVMGVSFNTWLNTSIEDMNKEHPEEYAGQNNLFWMRNFYPQLEVVADDLYKKGLIEKGEYVIEIDW